MSKEDVYKSIQKEIANYFRAFGFKKVKSHWHREFADSIVILDFYKVRGHSDDLTIVCDVAGGIAYKLFNPIFRPGRDFSTVTSSECDILFGIDTRLVIPGYLESPGVWWVTDKTDVALFLMHFKKALEPKLLALDDSKGIVSLMSNITTCLAHIDNHEALVASSLIKAAIAAKHLGMASAYKKFIEAIENHSRKDTGYVRYHLAALVKE